MSSPVANFHLAKPVPSILEEHSQPHDDESHAGRSGPILRASSTAATTTSATQSRTRLLPKLLSKISLILPNTGSVARDHLANERTWLAYVRTSLAVAGTGVALVQLFTISEPLDQAEKPSQMADRLRKLARPLGAATVLFAFSILAIGVQRYFKIQTAMTQGQFPPARSTVVAISTILAALVAVTFSVLVALPS